MERRIRELERVIKKASEGAGGPLWRPPEKRGGGGIRLLLTDGWRAHVGDPLADKVSPGRSPVFAQPHGFVVLDPLTATCTFVAAHDRSHSVAFLLGLLAQRDVANGDGSGRPALKPARAV